MNKELEEAIKRLKSKLKNDGPYIENCNPFSDLVHEIILDNKAIETVLNYIDNSIPKEVIKDKIKELQKEYINKMIETQEKYNYDQEIRHAEEDNVLCEILAKLGFKDLVEQYRETSKWYA